MEPYKPVVATKIRRFPAFFLGLAILLTVTAFGFLAMDSYYWYRTLIGNTRTYLRLEELRGEIIHLNELLSMCARMAVATGDLQWEKRHAQYVPRLAAALKEAVAFAPDAQSGSSVVETDTANRYLMQLEGRAFQWLRENRKPKAERLLSSKGYQRQNEIYSRGMQEFEQQLKAGISSASRKKREEALSQIVLIFFTVGILMLAWVMVLRALRNWEKFFAKQNRQLFLQANELAALNMNLDLKVAERTIQLERSREAAEEARKKAEQSKEELEKEMKERKSLEGQLLQAQKMEALGRLAGGIAHDFNNLLTIINGYAQMVLNKLKPEDDIRDEITEIQHAGNRAASLIKQLLTFSKRHIVSPQIINLNDVILNIDTMLSRLMRDNIKVENAPCDEILNVKADGNLMEQVLMNLVVNAADAIGDNSQGKIMVSVQSFVFLEKTSSCSMPLKPGKYGVLTVCDNGCGMDEEVKSHLFEPFFTTKGKSKGTGLGLATSFGIVKQFGGCIDVWSEPGRGTAFNVYLPCVSADNVKPVPEPSQAAPQGTETVLLVEDEESVRKLTAEILRGYGYNVHEASDGVEALQVVNALNSSKPHLLLTDVIMPRMNGRELAEKIRVLYPGIKILFVSGYTDDVISGKLLGAPGTAFISKPFLPLALACKVREVLNAA